jgi:hypothetical protein
VSACESCWPRPPSWFLGGGLRSASALEHTYQVWNTVVVQAPLAASGAESGLHLWWDAQSRSADAATTLVLRPAVGWSFNRQLSVMLGYAWVGTFVEGPDRIEHRPWEQLQATFRFDDLALALRTRLEQRLSAGELGWRPRQLVRLQQTLTPDVAAVVWDEIFVGLNATSFGQPSGFDQNRFFVGPAWTPSPGMRLEAGYMALILVRDAGDTWAHTLLVGFFANL